MQVDPEALAIPRLRRALGTSDLVLLNIAAIVGLRWFSNAAQAGPAGLSLWLLAAATFFLPSGLAVLELSSRIPHEGGLYLWSRAAFGDLHGFVVGWAYWVSNLVFFPSLLLFTSGVFLHVGGHSWLALAESPLYNAVFCLVLLWGATLLNILGLRRAKWLQNLGGIATLVVVTLMLVGGAIAWHEFGAATPMTAASLIPDLSSVATLGTFGILTLAYDGLELGPIMGDEIENPARTVPRSILISGIVIALLYAAGTAALLVALPPGQIDAIDGIPAAMQAIGARVGVPSFGATAAALVALGSIGGLSAWISGTARLPYVVGVGHYLPERLAGIHPKYGTPHVALLAQAGATSVVLLAAISGSAIHEAFVLLIDMTVALTCIVWLYLFASLAVLRHRAAGRNAGLTLIPGGPTACGLVAAVGIAATTIALAVSLVPPQGSAAPRLFLIKGVGGCVLILGVGVAIYRRGRSRRAAAASRP